MKNIIISAILITLAPVATFASGGPMSCAEAVPLISKSSIEFKNELLHFQNLSLQSTAHIAQTDTKNQKVKAMAMGVTAVHFMGGCMQAIRCINQELDAAGADWEATDSEEETGVFPSAVSELVQKREQVRSNCTEVGIYAMLWKDTVTSNAANPEAYEQMLADFITFMANISN